MGQQKETDHHGQSEWRLGRRDYRLAGKWILPIINFPLPVEHSWWVGIEHLWSVGVEHPWSVGVEHTWSACVEHPWSVKAECLWSVGIECPSEFFYFFVYICFHFECLNAFGKWLEWHIIQLCGTDSTAAPTQPLHCTRGVTYSSFLYFWFLSSHLMLLYCHCGLIAVDKFSVQ